MRPSPNQRDAEPGAHPAEVPAHSQSSQFPPAGRGDAPSAPQHPKGWSSTQPPSAPRRGAPRSPSAPTTTTTTTYLPGSILEPPPVEPVGEHRAGTSAWPLPLQGEDPLEGQRRSAAEGELLGERIPQDGRHHRLGDSFLLGRGCSSSREGTQVPPMPAVLPGTTQLRSLLALPCLGSACSRRGFHHPVPSAGVRAPGGTTPLLFLWAHGCSRALCRLGTAFEASRPPAGSSGCLVFIPWDAGRRRSEQGPALTLQQPA